LRKQPVFIDYFQRPASCSKSLRKDFSIESRAEPGGEDGFAVRWVGDKRNRLVSLGEKPHEPQGGTADRKTPTLLSQGGNGSQRGRAAFVKPYPQAIGDRGAVDGSADDGMYGSRCRPAMDRGESRGRFHYKLSGKLSGKLVGKFICELTRKLIRQSCG
jgi:hypothetical protein